MYDNVGFRNIDKDLGLILAMKSLQPRKYHKRLDSNGMETILKPVGVPRNFYITDTGDILYNDVLRTVASGFKKSQEYFIKYYQDGRDH
mmetsp:Transcript_2987/g.3482  ORF Transcript_2987/g.3482 Transcript_2987/m.3482 type:complete len:89 (+) Transcript_2987:54-320(+)